jgi:hypothetical protein
MAAKRGGAGGEATIDMIAIYELDGRHPPNTPPRLPFLSPGLPGRGLSFFAAGCLARARRFTDQ